MTRPRIAAAASLGAAAIHIAVLSEHAGTWAVAGVFFATVALLQASFAGRLLTRPSARLWVGGMGLNVSVIAIWLMSRTSGIPFGPHAGHVESVGRADAACAVLELSIVIISMTTFARGARRTALAALATVVAITSPLPVAARNSSEPHVAHRPHPANVLEGFAKGRVVALSYLASHCTVDPFDDLDGPGHEGDGVVAAKDPDELVTSPCIFGVTRHGSLPRYDPDGRDARLASRLYGIIPTFDADGDGIGDDNDPSPGVQTDCPQPGPPYSSTPDTYQTCAMHPAIYHVEPVLRAMAESASGVASPVDVPEGGLMNGPHSHLLDMTYSSVRWWNVVIANVLDPAIWPDANGHCPARTGCVTSMTALRHAQKAGKAEADIPSNLWFLFSVKPVAR